MPKANKTARPAASAANPVHPGQYVRDTVLSPKGLSVSAAAKLVGVGRPALSNFLNGHVAATPEMASRIEITFGVPAQRLLDMQAVYDAAQTKAKAHQPMPWPT
ncbi:MAG: HigA family addiction module antidote protein [Zoogloea sp.]|nr:HigA family addiction module antidote protein [Zoogloea sp.]